MPLSPKPVNFTKAQIFSPKKSSAVARRFSKSSKFRAESLEVFPSRISSGLIPDARFEVAASPSSLLSVSLSASQELYTRKGTLVGLSGKAENAISTLSVLQPFSRAVLRIPFLYQKIISTTPIKSLITANSSDTSITVVHLDGTTDWVLAGKALLAWTGQTLSLRPTVNYKINFAHWGNTEVTGRGLMALAGRGSISEMTLGEGETYIAHPGHVLAYSVNTNAPLPYRFKSSSFRIQVPNLLSWLPDTRFFRVMRQSRTWQTIGKILFTLRTWARRTIWGDRLFLRFQGPATLLLQSRTSKITETLTSRDVSEYADIEPGALESLSKDTRIPKSSATNVSPSNAPVNAAKMNVASIGSDRKVTITPANS